jgi:hypothetical protein
LLTLCSAPSLGLFTRSLHSVLVVVVDVALLVVVEVELLEVAAGVLAGRRFCRNGSSVFGGRLKRELRLEV